MLSDKMGRSPAVGLGIGLELATRAFLFEGNTPGDACGRTPSTRAPLGGFGIHLQLPPPRFFTKWAELNPLITKYQCVYNLESTPRIWPSYGVPVRPEVQPWEGGEVEGENVATMRKCTIPPVRLSQ